MGLRKVLTMLESFIAVILIGMLAYLIVYSAIIGVLAVVCAIRFGAWVWELCWAFFLRRTTFHGLRGHLRVSL
jgi:predicted membrane-bound dolichyl-phosphate-mannose-protein mannosyltransferase